MEGEKNFSSELLSPGLGREPGAEGPPHLEPGRSHDQELPEREREHFTAAGPREHHRGRGNWRDCSLL